MTKMVARNEGGPILLVMAAGMGSRYGGLKQIDPVGPNGEWIMDYSIYDAISAGFTKVVFVIRKDFEQAFRQRVEQRIGPRVEMAFVYQELDSLVSRDRIPAQRQKPWGTGHAVLVARQAINRPFAVINSDDYYGPGTYTLAKRLLDQIAASDGRQQVLIGYQLRNTLSEFGGVTRGICECDGDGYLVTITEQKGIERSGQDAIIRKDGSVIKIPGDKIVSMNFWGFHTSIFDHFERLFEQFIKQHADSTSEFLLPTIINTLVQEHRILVKVVPTTEGWFGVTYKQDKDAAIAKIGHLIREGKYPRDLWA